MATHSHILVWEIPWTEEQGRLQSMDCKGVGHDLVTKQQQTDEYQLIFWHFVSSKHLDSSHLFPFSFVLEDAQHLNKRSR